METGAILEAHKFQKKVTHSICLARENEHSELKGTLALWCMPRTFILLGTRSTVRLQMLNKILF